MCSDMANWLKLQLGNGEAEGERLFSEGEALRSEIGPILGGAGLSVTGWGSLIGLHPVPGPVTGPHDLGDADPRLIELLFHELLERGVYLAPRGFVALSLAVTEADRGRFVEALSASVAALVERTVLLPR